MRRLAILLSLAVLSACSTVDALSPVSPGDSGSAVAVRAPRFADSDPHEWDSGAPWTYAVHGTDVSKYQTSVDWQKAKASGVSFAFIKATEGGDRVDDMFANHWRGTNAAGIPRAAYHFYYFCRPAAEQARWFIENVPNERSSMPPVLDMEWNPQSPTCKLRPPAETVRREMAIFLKMVEKHYGKKPIIYTSVDFFDDNNLSTFRGYPYWLRSVAGHPTQKYGSHPFTFWQYTGTGVIPGMKGNADINVFNGSEAAWNKWLRQNTR
ncbi:glycoside hydrolase family 25 protein [Mesorhizobium retamae]|uniref:Glycoside hydrolase family 25 protein n=1 Tax=Mesorhizobium retamae TaxID=2912854 RepID=A0ABS9QJA0_9HYPH|nr:glycoside hydrolase family 25 protein [Mesorhizobium sp. IRAMC:0171]MCG7507519.1 glycoside hydrolase family 25 protein [Mesorhizobium sp. IRAMC:0171]